MRQQLIPSDFVDERNQHIPPWLLPLDEVSMTSKVGPTRKSTFPRCNSVKIWISWIPTPYLYRGVNVLMWFDGLVRVSFMGTVIAYIRKAPEFIYKKPPTSSTIFSPFRTSLTRPTLSIDARHLLSPHLRHLEAL